MFTEATCGLRLVYLLRIIPSEHESDSRISSEQRAAANETKTTEMTQSRPG